MSKQSIKMNLTNNDLDQQFELFKDGDEKAFTRIHSELHLKILSFGCRFMRDNFETDDIVQEAFLDIWNKRNTLQNMKDLKRQLYNEVRWKCLAALKRIKKRASIPIDLYEELGITIALSNPESELSQQETATLNEENFQLIEQAINCLPDKQKEIMQLRILRLNHKEIGALLKTPYQRVAGEEKAAIKRLRLLTYWLIILNKAALPKEKKSIVHFEKYLSPVETEIFRLQCEDGLSPSNISKVMGMSLKQVIQHHKKGQEKLKKIIPGFPGF